METAEKFFYSKEKKSQQTNKKKIETTWLFWKGEYFCLFSIRMCSPSYQDKAYTTLKDYMLL